MSSEISEEDGRPEASSFNRQKRCRYGLMLYNRHDQYIGRSLEEYGEFSEGEVDLFRQLVRPGQVALDVGANIGTHTVWLAQAVGPGGWVLAFEPQRVVFQTLCANVALNDLTNVQAYCAAVGDQPGRIAVPQIDYRKGGNFGGVGLDGARSGEPVPVMTIDDLRLKQCHFIKVDVEGMERAVLAGAEQTIAAHAPVLYVENDRGDRSEALIRHISDLGYRMYWHTPRLYNPDNFAGNPVDVFGNIVSLNMLCLPEADARRVEGLKPVAVPADSAG